MTFRTQATAPRGAAEQFYLSAHDSKGNCQVAGRSLQLCAASAVLGELVVSEYLVFSDVQARVRERGRLLLRAPRLHGRPTVARALLERICRSPGVLPCDWITDIAPEAPLWIARRMQAAGVVTAVMPNRLTFWRAASRFAPRDRDAPHKLGSHLRLALWGRSPLTLQDVFLAGLLKASHLHRARIGDIAQLDDLIARWARVLTTSADPQHSLRNNSLGVLLAHTEHLINTGRARPLTMPCLTEGSASLDRQAMSPLVRDKARRDVGSAHSDVRTHPRLST